jgi:ribosome-associated protein
MLHIRPGLAIEDHELEERFVRASGPGGQNVNKVATAVELRFDAGRSPALDDRVLQRLRALAGGRMTADDVLVIDARRHRSQAKNREDARARLVALLRAAATQPRRRRPTAPTAASEARRIGQKRRRAATKQARGRIEREE